MSEYLIDQHQNAIPRAMLIHELKKVHLQEHTFHAHDTGFIGRLKMLCMDVSSPRSSVESEWKRCSSPLSVEKKH